MADDRARATFLDAEATDASSHSSVPISSATTWSSLVSSTTEVTNGEAGVSAAERNLDAARANEQQAEANAVKTDSDLIRYQDTLFYVGVPPGKNNDVSGLSNLARNIGGSDGTSFFTTMLARHEQVHQQYLAQHVYGGSQAYIQQAGALSQQFLTRTAALTDAHTKALLSLYQSLQVQASVLSYIDILQSLCIICTCMVPLVFLMKRPPKGTKAAIH